MSVGQSGPMDGRSQPSRTEVAGYERLHVLDHPLCQDLLATIRDSRSDPALFGQAASQIASYLLWEACRDLELQLATVPGFSGAPIEVSRLRASPAGVVILRAGEVFAQPFRALFPRSPLFHLGVSRDEHTLDHRVYSDNLSKIPATTERLLILDPMLATGGSVAVAIERARDVYTGDIVVVALVSAPLGVDVVLACDDRVRIVTAALDERLDENGYILPGLGDAGDRFFGTGTT
ncbi:MAG TPA: uracil phosphoribosyltransferase [Thermomicrobiales bacterium]|nr:uracil phosphoribosyltransferase [Thermomicrobiales bacterium]